jgi:ParB family transcriptional regulator, chromosome partitioning protein
VSEKRRGLGRGLGALIPPSSPTRTGGDRPVDVFFPGKGDAGAEPGTTMVAEREDADGLAVTVEPDDATSHSMPPDPSAVNGSTDPSDFDLLPVPGATFAELPVTSIRPNPRQPRTAFDEEALAELVHSVKTIGVLQPVVVRPMTPPDGEVRYELVMGERRWRASQEAGLTTIPAIIRETTDDDLLRDALLENLHRSQLNALEEAAAYQQLLDDFGCTHEDLAVRIGRSRPQISNTLRLLKLPPLVQRRVAAGILSAGHARALLGLDESAAMEALAQRIVAEGLSVRAVEEIVALGDGTTAAPAKRKPRAGGHRSELDDLAARLGDRLDTRVAVALGRTKGKISIDFASVEDLNRILAAMFPDLPGAFKAGRA